MTRKEKARQIGVILDQLFPLTEVPLAHEDPYTLLIAVVLSAQCTDARVNQVTPILFSEADDPVSMIELGRERVEDIIRPCGLAPSKSANIIALSHQILTDHGGEVPDEIEMLKKLPGVGHKTASVVVSQAFGKPAFPVDTHIHRLAYRWGLSTGKNVVKTEEDLKKAFPIETWHKVHLQIIFFGRKYCPARGHNPVECPICSKFGRKILFGQKG